MSAFSGLPAHHRSPDYNFTIAYSGQDQGALASLISYRREIEWCVARHPILESLQWPFEDPQQTPRRISAIADEAYNFLQHMVSRLIMVTPQRDDDPENCRDCLIQIIVLSYRETPSILWIDDAVQSYATTLHENMLESLTTMNPVSRNATLMSWQKPRLEQYAKNTSVARNWASEDTPNLQLFPEFHVPAYLVSEFAGARTFWSQLLGRRPIMIVFLVEQVIQASLLNRLTGGFDQLLGFLPW